ncbi:MAG: hypothetical protein ACFE9L_17465 [Candidatus Hodarchaeota archaeon]
MILSKKIFFSLSAVSLLLVLMSSSGHPLFPPSEERHMDSVLKVDLSNNSILQNYALHDSISVNNDSELAVIASSGVGSANDPYIITG